MAGKPTSGGPRGSAITPGSAAAARLLEHVRSLGVRPVARELGIDPSRLRRLLGGQRRPSYDERAAVYRLYRIALGAWDEPAPVATAGRRTRDVLREIVPK
jgi:hypothetical protein